MSSQLAEMLPNMRHCRQTSMPGSSTTRTMCASGLGTRGPRLPHVRPASGGEPRSPLTAGSARRTPRMIVGRSAAIGDMK